MCSDFVIIAAYCQPVSVFRAEIASGTWITNLRNGFLTAFGRRPSPNEARSWTNSHPEIRDVLNDPVFDDCIIMLEAQSAIAGDRIDVLLLGQDGNGDMRLVVIELKGWGVVRPSLQPDMVQTILGGGYRDTLHPAIQAEGYLNLIRFSEESCDPTHPNFQITSNAYAYLHNMPGPPTSDPLNDTQFNQVNNDIPSFLAGEGRNLRVTLQGIIGNGGGSVILPLITTSSRYISRNLATLATNHMPGTPLFTLIGRQVTTNRTIQAALANLAGGNQKEVIIITGGPGSGKTAVGIQSLLTAVNNGMTQLAFVARNAGLVQPLRNMLRRTGLSPFIKYPFEFVTPFTNPAGNTYGSPSNSFDFVVVDEAHRLPEQNTFYKTWSMNRYMSGLTSAEEIIRCSRVSVFIIDPRQVVNPQNTDLQMITNAAAAQNANVTNFGLPYQFRAGGSSRYTDWIESMMYPDPNNRPHFNLQPGTQAEPMRFNIVDDPNIFQTMIAANPTNDIRMISGYCWLWNKPTGGRLPLDIQIINHPSTPYPTVSSFTAPWEDKRPGRAATWAIRLDAIDEVGCIYTIQGLDFDRICLIWPLDLQWDAAAQVWSGYPGRVPHKGTAGNGPNMYDNWDKDLKDLDQAAIVAYLQNVYNVLLTRANAEIFVYFMHAETRQYFETWL